MEPARRASTTGLPVVLEGETGTGKEGAARAIHAWSHRRGPFVAVNCAAIPPPMAEGELFGYRKGAFTGADRTTPGFFRSAHGGTLFLDEILELTPGVQAKLLRALGMANASVLLPSASRPPSLVDVRVVSASQESLRIAVAHKRFRSDLLARLDGLTVILLPLRARREDIAPLFRLLVAKEGGGRPPTIDSKLIECLLLYDWPLNVRELVLLVRRLKALHGTEPVLKRGMLPDRMTDGLALGSTPPPMPGPPQRGSTADESAFEQLVTALRAVRGNVSHAAAALGISRARAYRLLEGRPEFDVRALREDLELMTRDAKGPVITGCSDCGGRHRRADACPNVGKRVGQVLDGKYEIVRLLGKGGMGEVYEGRHLRIGRRVAVKFLHAHYAEYPEVARRFENEARAAGGAEHENIAGVYDVGAQPDGAQYLVMEFLDGEDLERILRREGRLTLDRAARLVRQVCAGLGVVHRVGIIHRDLKPANLFVTRRADGAALVKILDFGIAKLRRPEGDGGATKTGVAIGTAYYMSPEQARGQRDLYAGQ